MLRQPSSLRRPIELAPTRPRRGDLAMTVLQYGTALLALAVAILLAVFR
jgi:hypothetical protein